ncbi:CDP-alcohol phosphatidyltransferase family protein [Frankia sp. QA3]|uniref:CDP-alcohol phosphatidyltransferase family protein n=1 Tax=Frankia sp. QA3 TaxID=710111 RepID=UPI000269CBF5|nr:phosphatidylglycerophosphate synthase [Frankia sp. QA3]
MTVPGAGAPGGVGGRRPSPAAQPTRELTPVDTPSGSPEPGGAAVAGPHARPSVSVLNVANLLTIIRLVLVPVFVVFLFAGPDTDGWRYAAFVAYAVAAVTDQIDGSIARHWHLVTDFGILVDPIADKALTGAALISLSILGELPWPVTAVVLLREVGVTLLRLWVIRFGVIAASRGGKAKTLLLNVAIGLYVLPLAGIAATSRAVILAAGVVVAVATGVDYVYRALALRRRAARDAVGEPAGGTPITDDEGLTDAR